MTGAGAEAKTFLILEQEPGIEIWVLVPQTQFVGKASFTNITNGLWFILQWFFTKLFWSRSPKLLDVGAGTKNLDAWNWSRIRSLKVEFRLHSPAYQHVRATNQPGCTALLALCIVLL